MHQTLTLATLSPVRVERNEELCPGVFLLTLASGSPFLAGQTIKLATDAHMTPRVYSLCSGPTAPHHQVLYNVQTEGLLSPQLARLKAGDTLYTSAPYGSFLDQGGPGWWIATGTGIAPFRSMLKAGLADGKRLLHGVRHTNQFYFEDEFVPVLGDRYVRCCSSTPHTNGYHGRVSDYLAAVPSLSPDHHYYLCGSAIMIVEVRDLLIARGIPFTRILAEIYF